MHNVTRFPPSPNQEVSVALYHEKIAKLAADKPAADMLDNGCPLDVIAQIRK